METYKNQKNHNQLCLFLFSNNVNLKNNNRNYKKKLMDFVGARTSAINLFQVDFDIQ